MRHRSRRRGRTPPCRRRLRSRSPRGVQRVRRVRGRRRVRPPERMWSRSPRRCRSLRPSRSPSCCPTGTCSSSLAFVADGISYTGVGADGACHAAAHTVLAPYTPRHAIDPAIRDPHWTRPAVSAAVRALPRGRVAAVRAVRRAAAAGRRPALRALLAALESGASAGIASRTPPAFESVRSPFVMDGEARRLVHQLKYEGHVGARRTDGAPDARHRSRIEADLVVPVPLHRGRQRSRGYNQSQMLARHSLARRGSASLSMRAARRVRATAPLATVAWAGTNGGASSPGPSRRTPRARRGPAYPARGRRGDDGRDAGCLRAGAAGRRRSVVRCVTFARAD